MAELAAGLIAAEEIVSTSVQAGAAGYAVAKPTMPVRASFEKFGSATVPGTSRSSLARAHHTLTVVDNKAYIFGGQIASGDLASNEIHALTFAGPEEGKPEYQMLPAITSDAAAPGPAARTKHAACAVGKHVVVYGGCGQLGELVDDRSTLWQFDTQRLMWQVLQPETHPERVPAPRSEGILLSHDNNLILFGGRDGTGAILQDVWHFNTFTKTWNALPSAPIATDSAAIAANTLYLISSHDSLSSDVHSLAIELYAPQPPTWQTTTYPTNPLTPGPGTRTNAGFLPVSTGYGRNFLLYLFGDKKPYRNGVTSMASNAIEAPRWDDLWTFQVSSSEPEMQTTTDFANAIKPARIKDQIREKLGVDTGNMTWCKVEPHSTDETASEKGSHPGPRSCFACGAAADARTVILWGGISDSGEVLGDGWILRLE
ncbi:hypothetical protein Micbo1qcDRAFT_211346 [Microdochium bolleyi]|uniref:Galactose oxidase n=1 Tax=Microdochium bolleyi TaxID=196109 RepID=A0A136JIU9_9PEZI|nr:hypothetical protein Micbo1qcDRAFT_211346 [Microdochium bolleyi]